MNLILWVNHKGPAAALGHQDPILCRDVITRKSFCVPLPNHKRVTKDVNQAEVRADGNVQLLALYYPLVNKLGKGRRHVY